jgi:alanine dehydrogenase
MTLNSIGIRREDKNVWEKRAPLIPTHVRELIQLHGLNVCVQPSDIRVFSDQEYAREGALLSDSLSECRIVLAIKEIPVELIDPDKIYVFFSHTAKGQIANRPMLERLIQNGCTLVDYERICDAQGRRLLFFGVQAGQAGMVETLASLGRRLSAQGTASPFSHIEQPYRYGSLVDAREALQRLGWAIHDHGLDSSLVPLVCGFLGYGRTSEGAQEMFDLLPVEEVLPEDLLEFVESGFHSAHRVYKVVFKEEHMVQPRDRNQPFVLQDYYDHPERYRSVFSRYLPGLSLAVNCIYWEERYPRFITKSDAKSLFSQRQLPRLRVISDISCDIEGAIEFTHSVTSPEHPVFLYDPLKNSTTSGFQGNGIAVMAIDNLPAEIPLESSIHFSGTLKSFVPALATADFSSGFDECQLPPEIRRAVILYQGNFTPDYAYMQDYLG